MKAKSIRTTMSIIAQRNMESAQLNVTGAFLYPYLKQELFMELPDHATLSDIGLKPPATTNPNTVVKIVVILLKCLYGLKQSGFEWNGDITIF